MSTWEIYGSFNGNMLANPGPPPTSFRFAELPTGQGHGRQRGADHARPGASNGANTITRDCP